MTTSQDTVINVISVLSRCSVKKFVPFHWTFSSPDGSDTVEFVFNKDESTVIHTRVKKFLGITTGRIVITFSKNDTDVALWNYFTNVLNDHIAK